MVSVCFATGHPKNTSLVNCISFDLCLLGFCHFLLTSECVSFGSLSLNTSFSGSLDLGTFLIHLFLEGLLTLLLGFSSMNLFSVS